MHLALRILIGVPAVLFTGVGLAWLVVPWFAADQFRMALLDGAGLSTQVADLGSFFATLGVCLGVAAITQRRVWLIPPLLLVGIAAPGRLLAWMAHGAALTWDMIAVEAVLAGLIVVAWTTSAPTAPGQHVN